MSTLNCPPDQIEKQGPLSSVTSILFSNDVAASRATTVSWPHGAVEDEYVRLSLR
jgi:hypothetical protein